jgi:hypothetical protein
MRASIAARLFVPIAATALLAGPASAVDPIVEKRGWPMVARAESPGCVGEVRGNGKIFWIAGTGLRPGEALDFHLTNADIRPVRYRIVANSSGEWSQYYVPFLWRRPGGHVSVTVASASCELNLQFDGARQAEGYDIRLDRTY